MKLLIFAFLLLGQNKPTFILKVQNVTTTKGTLRIAFYKKGSDFPNNNAMDIGKEVGVPNTGEVIIKFDDIPPAEYAVAIFHDLNNNKKIEKNIIGMPTEPFGFTRNFKPKLSAPVFNDCNIFFTSANNSFTIKLID